MDLIEKMTLYHTCMNSEQTIRTSYQYLWATTQTIIFGVCFLLSQLGISSNLWLLALIGIFTTIPFCYVCDYRAQNADFWRKRIIIEAKGTELESDFKSGRYGHPDDWHPFFDTKSQFGKFGRIFDRLFGHWFERILMPYVILIWIGLLIFMRRF